MHTVQFSNHSGYGAWRGPPVSADAIRLVVRGIEERGVLGKCDGVLSGYLGSPDIGEVMIDAVARVKSANPAARSCCDPVIGDTGRGIFVRQGVPEFIKAPRMLPIADCYAQSVRARISGRSHDTDHRGPCCRNRCGACPRAERRPGDIDAHR